MANMCILGSRFCTLCTENRYVDLTDPKTLLVDVTRHHLWPNYQVWSRCTCKRPRNYKKKHPFCTKNGQKCDEWSSCAVHCTAYWAICKTVVVISLIGKLIYIPKMTPVKQGRVDPRGCGDIQISARFVQKNVQLRCEYIRLYTKTPFFGTKNRISWPEIDCGSSYSANLNLLGP